MLAQNGDADETGDGAFEAFRRAEKLLDARRPREALAALEPALRSQPDLPSVLLLAGRAYFKSAQLRRAEAMFDRLLEQDPADHYARFILGRTLQRQGRLIEARAQLRLAYSMRSLPEYQDALSAVLARLKLA
ncbi:tetratricopeptide repeat protein [Sciscionella marina]|uniref:tetratricopeptide repeat protein n=1 Tax=Sciscionella marina TaxID=508770 RepID=UPI00035CAB09|nr:tetratricopeptide repeat protein [Sciscionella marina]